MSRLQGNEQRKSCSLWSVGLKYHPGDMGIYGEEAGSTGSGGVCEVSECTVIDQTRGRRNWWTLFYRD